ncbi:hypothetical protein Tco_0538545 [Tanacetum coccineum]
MKWLDTSPDPVHNIYTFYESVSSESESEDVKEIDIKTLTLEQYLTLNLNNTCRRISNPEDATFEIKGQVLRDLRKTTFSRSSTENAIKHIRKVLEVASLFNTNDSALLRLTASKALKSIQELDDHSRKWHNEESKKYSNFIRPMLATAHARIDVFGKKISLEVGTKQITFDINERESPAIISPVCVINNFSKSNEIDELRNLEELLMSDDIDGDLGRSARLNDDSSGMFYNPNSNSSISIDDFVEMDDLWDNLDFRDLTNKATKSPVKFEFLSSGNRIHLHSLYNLQITCKIGFVNFEPYIEPQSPFNIMSRKAYNSIMKHEIVYTGNNMVGFARNLYVVVRGHQFLFDFIILENINEFMGNELTEVLFGQPFEEHVGIIEDQVKGDLWFKIRDDKTIFNMPRAEERFGKLTVRQHNTMGPLLKISDEDESK